MSGGSGGGLAATMRAREKRSQRRRRRGWYRVWVDAFSGDWERRGNILGMVMLINPIFFYYFIYIYIFKFVYFLCFNLTPCFYKYLVLVGRWFVWMRFVEGF